MAEFEALVIVRWVVSECSSAMEKHCDQGSL